MPETIDQTHKSLLRDAVRELTTSLAEPSDGDAILRGLLGIAVKVVDASGGTIYLHDPKAKELLFSHVAGAKQGDGPATIGFGLVGESLADDEGIAGQVFQSGEAEITSDAKSDPDHAARVDEDFEYDTQSMVTIPLQMPDGATYGVLQVLNKRSGEFTEDDLTALDVLARIASLGLHHHSVQPGSSYQL